MFIQDAIGSGNYDGYKIFKKSIQNACTYPEYFKYWRENLFERLMRLFIWEGMPDILPREIEQRLILAGHCGIAQYENELTAFFGSFLGPTVYQDNWTYYNVHSPIYSGTYTIDEDIVIILNNSLKNATFAHVNHYASLLAHAEVSLMKMLVNARDSGGVPIAKNEKAKQSLLDYQGKMYNGKIGYVSDLAGIGVEFLGADRHTNLDLNAVWDVRTKLMKNFYADIGIRASFDKRSNTIVDEITSDSGMLLYNVSDMLHERELACERVNNMFGTSWSVKLSEEIAYNDENEPEPELEPEQSEGGDQ